MEALFAIFIAIVIALLICAAICLVAWGIIALIRLIPMVPDFIKQILTVVVYVFAGLACILVVIRALSGGLPSVF